MKTKPTAPRKMWQTRHPAYHETHHCHTYAFKRECDAMWGAKHTVPVTVIALDLASVEALLEKATEANIGNREFDGDRGHHRHEFREDTKRVIESIGIRAVKGRKAP